MAENEKGATTPTKKQAPAPAPTAPAVDHSKVTHEKPGADKPLSPAPALGEDAAKLVADALKANGGKYPTKHYAEKTAFGHTYAEADYTDHTVDWVKALVWSLRRLNPTPSYRSISEALGIQCSAITEAVAHGEFRKDKDNTDDSWKKVTGGRVKFLQEQEARAAKAEKPTKAS